MEPSFALARFKVTNEGVWPAREETEHTHSRTQTTTAAWCLTPLAPPEHIIHVMRSLISAASLAAEGRVRMCG